MQSLKTELFFIADAVLFVKLCRIDDGAVDLKRCIGFDGRKERSLDILGLSPRERTDAASPIFPGQGDREGFVLIGDDDWRRVVGIFTAIEVEPFAGRAFERKGELVVASTTDV